MINTSPLHFIRCISGVTLVREDSLHTRRWRPTTRLGIVLPVTLRKQILASWGLVEKNAADKSGYIGPSTHTVFLRNIDFQYPRSRNKGVDWYFLGSNVRRNGIVVW